MTHLLQSWVLQETGIQLSDLSQVILLCSALSGAQDVVGLSGAPCVGLQDFSTGYKIGQVLAKLNLQPDFNMFEQKPTPEAIINNFTRLQQTLKSLGIKFDTRRANSLVREDKGAASELLHEIRTVIVLFPLQKGCQAGRNAHTTCPYSQQRSGAGGL